MMGPVELIESEEEDEDDVRVVKPDGMCSNCGSVVLPHVCVFHKSKVLRTMRRCTDSTSEQGKRSANVKLMGDKMPVNASNGSAYSILSSLLEEHKDLVSSRDELMNKVKEAEERSHSAVVQSLTDQKKLADVKQELANKTKQLREEKNKNKEMAAASEKGSSSGGSSSDGVTKICVTDTYKSLIRVRALKRPTFSTPLADGSPMCPSSAGRASLVRQEGSAAEEETQTRAAAAAGSRPASAGPSNASDFAEELQPAVWHDA